MNTKTLLADPAVLRIEKTVAEKSSLIIFMKSVQKQVRCPVCQHISVKRHSRYARCLADLPWQGVAVKLCLSLRRFFCTNDLCARKIFAERLPKVAADFARRTLRLNESLTALAFALGGEAGRRLAEKLGFLVSADTLLRRIRQSADKLLETPRVLGIDDFAFLKRHNYGTILIDLEAHEPIDLLPDRESKTVAAWLKAHPGVEIVSRDRSMQYAEGITLGSPEAEQVADRWHLLKNVVDVLKEFLNQHHCAFQKARQAVIERQSKAAETMEMPIDRRTKAKEQTRATRLELYRKVQALKKEGCQQNEIVRRLGISKQYARRLIHAETFPERSPFPPRKTSVDIYADYLHRRWKEGCQNATHLWRELKEQGFPGALGAVTRYVRLRMREPSEVKQHYIHRARLPAIKMPLPSARRAAWLFLKSETELIEEERLFVGEMLKSSVEIRQAVAVTKKFQEMVKKRNIEWLEEWLLEAEKIGTKWKNFVKGLRQDYKAVAAALTTVWSNGQVEGQVNRLKFLKRQMYGRAKFDLLRARVLYRG
jgi:transposase